MRPSLFLACAATALSGCIGISVDRDPAPVAQPTADSAVTSAIASWSNVRDFNGVIAVRYPDDTITTYSTGLADFATGRELTDNSAFQTGSVNKFILAIAAFALADRGKLDLDAPIETYLPEFRNKRAGRATVGHLLTNRSGISQARLMPMVMEVAAARKEDPEAEIGSLPNLPKDIDASLEFLAAEASIFEPGSAFDYANSNWVLMTRILERVGGEEIAAILHQYVFEPAGMARSGTFIDRLDSDGADMAIGYNPDGEPLTSDFPLPRFIGGGTFTTAADMIALMRALYGGKLLSQEALDRFSRVETPSEHYAYGGRIVGGERAPEHGYSWQSGSNGATKMVAVYNIDTGYAFVALSNDAHSQKEMFDLAMKLETER